MKNIVGKPF